MKKIVALLIAAMLVVATMGVAFADATDDVNVTVSGIKEGNTLVLYTVADAAVGAQNQIVYTMTTGLPEDYNTIEEIAAASAPSDAAKMAQAYGAFFGGQTPSFSDVADSSDTATVSVAPGYYYAIVTGTADTGVVYKPMLINAVPVVNSSNGYDAHADITIAAKQEPITITKQEEQSPTVDTLVKTTDGYKIGDNIHFVITTTIPNYPQNSKNATVVIKDTPNGLVDDARTVVVKVGGSVITDANYDVTAGTPANGFTVTLKDKTFILDHAGDSLVVEYTAQLVGPANEDGLTSNTATLTYNPNPYEDATVEPDDTVDQKTYGFVFNKTDDKNAGLAGATFALYDAAGTNAITDKDGVALTFTTTVDGDGKAYVYWDGLADGTYTVKETTAPAGYMPVADFQVTLSATVCNKDNPATSGTTETNYLVITDNVVNNKGAELPETGGIGTTIFYVSGLVMVLGAAAILVARRKAESEA